MDNNRIERFNQFILFLLIISVVGGNYMVSFNVAGIEIYGFRILLAIAVIYLFITKQFKWFTSSFTKKVFFILLFWLFYALLSLIWAPDLLFGIKDIFYIALGITSYFVLLSLSQTWKVFELSFESSWIAVYCFILVFSLFEIITGKHLEGDFLESLDHLGALHYANHIPIVSMVSQNIFAIYLCMAMVLSTYFFKVTDKRFLHGFVIISAFVLLFFTESRLGLLFVASFYSILFLKFLVRILFQKNYAPNARRNFLASMILVTSGSLVYFSYITYFKGISYAQSSQVRIAQIDETGQKDGSINIEKNALILVSGEKKDTNQLHLPNKIFLVEKEVYRKLLSGQQLELSFENIPENIDIDARSEAASSSSMLFYVLFTVLILFVVAYFCFPNGKFSQLSINYLLLAFVFLGVGIFSQYSLDSANLDTKNKGLINKNERIGLTSKFVTISAESNTAKMLANERSEACWILQTKLKYDISKYSNNSSNKLRVNLVFNGLDFLKESKYMGVGAGGFRAYSLRSEQARDVQGLVNPHNFVIEILSQYGILVFGLLLFIGFLIIKKLILDALHSKLKSIHVLVLGLIICLAFLGNSNSTFLSLPINWMLIALLVLASNQMMTNQPNRDEV